MGLFGNPMDNRMRYTTGGIVDPRQQRPVQIDQTEIYNYNLIMQRYYEVGRDLTTGIVSRDTAEFQLKDIYKQLEMLKRSTRNGNLAAQIRDAMNRVKDTLTHISTSESE